MISEKIPYRLFLDLPIDNIKLNDYKLCASDYFNGIGPFGSPFAFLSYGITYSEMVYFSKFSIEFLNFIFDFLIKTEKPATRDKVIEFLKEAQLTRYEIKDRLEDLLNDR